MKDDKGRLLLNPNAIIIIIFVTSFASRGTKDFNVVYKIGLSKRL